MKVTEAEITAVVRKFFQKNGFWALATAASGEKLYYTVGGNRNNQKQPDSVFRKQGLIVVCEDKIVFSHLYRGSTTKLSDYEKLRAFLDDPTSVATFLQKVSRSTAVEELVVIGCLSSLGPKADQKNLYLDERIVSIIIGRIADEQFMVQASVPTYYSQYFDANPCVISL
jgi:hypothetical protein